MKGYGGCAQAELVAAWSLGALPADEVAAVRAHVDVCLTCQAHAHAIQEVVKSFADWPTEVVRPGPPLWDRLAGRLAGEGVKLPAAGARPDWAEPAWEEVAPGITCKLLATDEARRRVSMLVRLAPGVSYPPHTHAGVEELHLLQGELWIDDRKLYPGDYNLGPPGTGDQRVFSEAGCMCVLVTSPDDVLR